MSILFAASLNIFYLLNEFLTFFIGSCSISKGSDIEYFTFSSFNSTKLIDILYF